MIQKFSVLFLTSLFSLSCFANSDLESKVYMGGSLGYTFLSGTFSSDDGESVGGRINLGVDFWEMPLLTIGAELGAQSGSSPRFAALDASDLPLQTTLKPMADLLLTSKIRWETHTLWYALFKVGIAYRSLVATAGNETPPLNQVAPEFQAGFGYTLNEKARLMAYYQLVYSGDSAGLQATAGSSTGSFTRIPTEQGVLVGFEYGLN